MASLIYGNVLADLVAGTIDFDAGTFKVALVGSTYDAIADETKRDGHDRFNDITDEVSGTGYTAGGATSTITVGSYDGTNNRLDITIGAVSWASSTITAYGAVVYQDTGVASTSPLVCYVDFGSAVSSSSGTFSLTASTLRLAL